MVFCGVLLWRFLLFLFVSLEESVNKWQWSRRFGAQGVGREQYEGRNKDLEVRQGRKGKGCCIYYFCINNGVALD